MSHYINDTTASLKFFATLASDHFSPATGKTFTITRSKSGTTSFVTATGTVTEIASGWYDYAPGSADVDTLGEVAFHFTAAATDPVDFKADIVVNPPSVTNYTSTRAGYLDTVNTNLNAQITSRLATASYTAPDPAATIAAAVWATTITTIATHTTTAAESLRSMLRLFGGAKKSGPLVGVSGNVTIRDEADSKDFMVVPVDITGYQTGAPSTFDPI